MRLYCQREHYSDSGSRYDDENGVRGLKFIPVRALPAISNPYQHKSPQTLLQPLVSGSFKDCSLRLKNNRLSRLGSH